MPQYLKNEKTLNHLSVVSGDRDNSAMLASESTWLEHVLRSTGIVFDHIEGLLRHTIYFQENHINPMPLDHKCGDRVGVWA